MREDFRLDDVWLSVKESRRVVVFGVELVPIMKVKVTFDEFGTTLASCRTLLNYVPQLFVPSASENDSVLKTLVCVVGF